MYIVPSDMWAHEDSKQLVHPHGLIRVFVVSMKKNVSWVVQNELSKESDQTVNVLT